MGLDAKVMCNCFINGKTIKPPYSEFVTFDEERYLILDLPFDDNKDKYRLFYKWLQEACEHPFMNYASEHISNWSGYRAFQQALSDAGRDNFPTLLEELPECNGGITNSEAAAIIIDELKYFIEKADLGWNTILVNSKTNERLYEYIAEYEGKFILGGSVGIVIGIDKNGLFIQAGDDPSKELFRSLRFEQVLLEPELTENHQNGLVEYIDIDSGRQFRTRLAIGGNEIPWPDGRMENDKGQVRLEYPKFMHISTVKRESSDFDYILQPLNKICIASVTTGNPIRWC